MVKEFLDILPKKLTITLLSFLLAIIIVTNLLNYLSKINERRIDELNKKIDNLTQEYSNKLKEEDYIGILHLIAIDYLFSNKRKNSELLTNLPKYLPKSLRVNSISIDNINSKIELSVSVPNFLEYAKIKKYFENKKDTFPNFKIENLSLNQQTGVVDFKIAFDINPIFYKQ